MEGILLAAPIFASTVAIIGAGFGLAVVLQMILLGYVADEEAKGRRLFWAEFPIAEARKTAEVRQLTPAVHVPRAA